MQGILTLRASGGHSSRDLERARMLVDSLDRQWMGEAPFNLTVIALDEDFDLIVEQLRAQRTQISVVKETDVLPCLKHLPPVPGWNKQQALKLAAYRLVSGPFYLVLDADIVCCKPFDESALVIDGKSVVDWEDRSRHPEWWAGTAHVLKTPLQLDLMGFSVTPEVLSTAICAELEKAVAAIHEMDCWEYLLTFRGWTEFSLYSTFAMQQNLVDKHHHSPSWMRNSRKSLRVSQNFWGREYYDRWQPELSLEPEAEGIFMICQSNAEVDPHEIRQRLKPIFDKSVPFLNTSEG